MRRLRLNLALTLLSIVGSFLAPFPSAARAEEPEPPPAAQPGPPPAAQPEPPPAAQPGPPPAEDRVEEIDQRIKILERKRELEQEQAAEKAKGAPVISAGRDGFSIASADGAYRFYIRGYLQADATFAQDDDLKPLVDTFQISRARPIFEGTVGRFFEFRVMPDFGMGRTVLQDAYMDWKFADYIRLRAGKYKAPFGLERLQSATNLVFVARALPTNLVPNRDEGLQLFGDVAGGVLGYAAGVFNGVTDLGSTDIDVDDSKETDGRVFAHPFKKTSLRSLHGLGVGLAATYGSNSGTPATPALPSYRTAAQQTFFSYLTDAGTGGVPPATAAGTAVADGRRYRLSPQAYYYFKRLGLMGEYVISHQEVTRDALIEDLRHTAWQATVSVLLTNDEATYKGVSPKRPYDPHAGAWGAFEVALRAGALRIDDDTFPTYADPTKSARVAREGGVGFNWYLNRNVKLMLDYVETRFDGGAAAATGGDREDEKVLLNRFQVSF